MVRSSFIYKSIEHYDYITEGKKENIKKQKQLDLPIHDSKDAQSPLIIPKLLSLTTCIASYNQEASKALYGPTTTMHL